MEKKVEVSRVKCDFFRLRFPLSSAESEIDASVPVAPEQIGPWVTAEKDTNEDVQS